MDGCLVQRCGRGRIPPDVAVDDSQIHGHRLGELYIRYLIVYPPWVWMTGIAENPSPQIYMQYGNSGAHGYVVMIRNGMIYCVGVPAVHHKLSTYVTIGGLAKQANMDNIDDIHVEFIDAKGSDPTMYVIRAIMIAAELPHVLSSQTNLVDRIRQMKPFMNSETARGELTARRRLLSAGQLNILTPKPTSAVSSRPIHV